MATPLPVILKDVLIAGNYRIIEEIGRGGMGAVCKADDVRPQRSVALKFPPPRDVAVRRRTKFGDSP